jgi:hypothetical protein
LSSFLFFSNLVSYHFEEIILEISSLVFHSKDKLKISLIIFDSSSSICIFLFLSSLYQVGGILPHTKYHSFDFCIFHIIVLSRISSLSILANAPSKVKKNFHIACFVSISSFFEIKSTQYSSKNFTNDNKN